MAVDSLRPAVDWICVFEGPAGPDRCEDAPASDLPFTVDWNSSIGVERGAWPTDAAKRTAMVKYAQKHSGPEPLWGIWVDGDEVLIQGEFLRDYLQALLWQDEADPELPPSMGMPIRIVEMDGSVGVCRAKCIRIDLVSNYVVSSSGIKLKNGVVVAEGNLPQKLSEWWGPRAQAIAEDRMYLEPPLPGEPYLLHRSPLRHPARAGLRMHEQEASELDRLGLLKSS